MAINLKIDPNHQPPGRGLSQMDQLVANSLTKNLYDFGPLSLVKGGPFSVSGLPHELGAMDVFAAAHLLRNIGRELFGNIDLKQSAPDAVLSVAKSKGARFVANQVLLTSLNSRDPELGGALNATWNPLSLVASATPLTRGTTLGSPTVAQMLGRTFDPTTSRIAKYRTEITNLTKLRKNENPEEILGNITPPGKLPALFGKKGITGMDTVRAMATAKPVKRPKDTPERVHARILEAYDGDEDGIITAGYEPDDNKIYLPLVFQDLRDGDGRIGGSFLYFRAFIKPDSVDETFTPVWNPAKYYGRVDDIPTYMGTSRIINFAFDVVAWQPADIPFVYRKLHKLQSMVYPSFDDQGFMSAGPIIRMRMGDLFSTTNRGKLGLPGYLTSINISYDNVWNIETNFKIPQKATVSISFTALHEGNPGTYQKSAIGERLSTFGVGVEDPNRPGAFLGDEMGIRGLLENIKRTRRNNNSVEAGLGTGITSDGSALSDTFISSLGER